MSRARTLATKTTVEIGWPFPVFDDVTGSEAPDNSGSAKYVQLTAGLTDAGEFNEGLLTSESVSGSSPTITATATISHADSPMDGQTVRLINTEERFLRAGGAGTTQDWAIENITGVHRTMVRTLFSLDASGAFSQDSTVSSGGVGGASENVRRVSLDASRVVNTDDETRPRNVGITYYMRIA